MSSGFRQAFDKIKENKSKAESGKFNCIPFGLDRFEGYLPGIMQGIQYLITANSGVGKSQFTKNVFIRNPVRFIEEHPEANIKLKIFYFALEESVEQFYNFMISTRLKEQFNISLDPVDLLSYKGIIDDETIKRIEETRDYFSIYDKYVEIIDHIYNPTGIFKHVRDYARNNGRFFFEGEELDPQEHSLFDTYVPDRPDEYVIVITDHISLLSTERGTPTLHETMTKWSVDYCRKQLTKNYNYIVVNVQQQSSASEQKQFTFRGENIVDKITPSLDGLGDNKLTQRDAFVVLGLFNPDKYNIEDYMGYNIELMQDNFRSLHILKNRIGIPNKIVPLYFNGATNEFKELVPADEMTNEVYEKVINKIY